MIIDNGIVEHRTLTNVGRLRTIGLLFNSLPGKPLGNKALIVVGYGGGGSDSNGREPKSYLGRVFNSKLGRIGWDYVVSAQHTSTIY